MPHRPKIFLIDGNAISYRSFYAIRELSTSDGQPTNAIHGFAMRLMKVILEEKPEYLAVTFDRQEKTFRHELLESYKAHRKPMPDLLAAQMEPMRELVKAFGIPLYDHVGFEADDVMATLAIRAVEKGMDVFILTGDKDMLQIIGPHIFVMNIHQKDRIFDEEVFRKEYGFLPEKMIDYLSLLGDAADGVPSVPGIGKKTAQKIILEYGSIDNLLSRVDTISQKKLRDNIKEHVDTIAKARRLIALEHHVPIEIAWEDSRLPELQGNTALKDFFRRYELYRLLNHVEAQNESPVDLKAKAITVCQGLDDWQSWSQMHQREPSASMYVRFDPKGQSLWLSSDASCDVFCLDHALVQSETRVREDVSEMLCAEDRMWMGFDVKACLKCFHAWGIRSSLNYFDFQVGAFIINPGRSEPSLHDVQRIFLDKEPGSSDQASHESVLAEECDGMKKLYPPMIKALEEKNLVQVWSTIEKPLIPVLARMELQGIKIDVAYLQSLGEEFETEVASIQKEIYALAEEEFNINSPKQLGAILFQKLQLPVIKRIKTGASTNGEVLEKLSGFHELPARVLQYRHLTKLLSTYVKPLPELRDPRTDRIHSTFIQTGAATGRLASRDPNVQNIPIRTEEGEKIRRGFIPDTPSDYLMSADYSQIELRVLAHVSGDPVLTEAFASNHDIHARTAALLYDVHEADITKDMRRVAKTVNFGILYGMGAYGLAKDLKISPKEAQDFIDRYLAVYPGIERYTEAVLKQAKEDGYVETLFGRKRPVFLSQASRHGGRTKGGEERMAVNAPLQGAAADIIKKAMIMIDRDLQDQGLQTKMLLQIHDELLFNCPQSELDQAKTLIQGHMEGCVSLSVPLCVNIKTGKTWAKL